LVTARKLAWAFGIPRHLKAYPADVPMIWPVAGRGRPPQRHVPYMRTNSGHSVCRDRLARPGPYRAFARL